MSSVSDLVLYDGICGLCNRSVRFILNRDRVERFRFAPLQSEFGKRILSSYEYGEDVLDSVIVVVDHGKESERLLQKSDAVLYIASRLSGIWRLLSVVRILPRSVLDRLYGMIASHRYRWFGRYDSCPLPEERYRSRFVGV